MCFVDRESVFVRLADFITTVHQSHPWFLHSISSTKKGDVVTNLIAQALAERIIHAARFDQDYQVKHTFALFIFSLINANDLFRLSSSSLKFQVFREMSSRIHPLKPLWVLNIVPSTVVVIVYMN